MACSVLCAVGCVFVYSVVVFGVCIPKLGVNVCVFVCDNNLQLCVECEKKVCMCVCLCNL